MFVPTCLPTALSATTRHGSPEARDPGWRRLRRGGAMLLAVAFAAASSAAAGPLGKGLHVHHGHAFNPLVEGYPNPTDPAELAKLDALLDDPYITHVQLSYHWLHLEPADADYRWDIIDADLAPWAAVGKKVWLEVVAASKRGSTAVPRGFPDWIMSPPYNVPVVGSYHNDPTTGEARSRYPVYWDPTYQMLWERFVAAFAARFDGHAAVEFVSIGGHTAGTEPSLSAEDNGYYFTLVNPAVTALNWTQAGLDPGITTARFKNGHFFNSITGDPPEKQIYLNVVKWAVDAYKARFVTTPVAMIFKKKNNFFLDVAAYSLIKGLGVGSNGLNNNVLSDMRIALRDYELANLGGFVSWFEFANASPTATSQDIYNVGIGIDGHPTLDPWSRVSYVPATSVRVASGETPEQWSETMKWVYENLLDRVAPASVVWPATGAVTVAASDITLQWISNGEYDLAGYEIYRSTDAVNYTRIQTLWTATTFTDAGLPPAQTYHYKVTAVDDGITRSGAIGNESSFALAIAQSGTITERTPPVITVPADIVAEAASAAGAIVFFTAAATDNVDGAVPVSASPASGSVFALGTTTVALSATDAAGNTATGSFTVTVVDTTAPVIAALTPSSGTLWPPNHKMVAVTLSATVADAVDAAPFTRIVAVGSNEPEDGTGDGDTAPDWVITGALTLDLRAERSGGGGGRIYTITVQSTDAAANSATRDATVSVPHHK